MVHTFNTSALEAEADRPLEPSLFYTVSSRTARDFGDTVSKKREKNLVSVTTGKSKTNLGTWVG